jgi:cyclophilin family peptidyl-prolyl cis-trans isomerase
MAVVLVIGLVGAAFFLSNRDSSGTDVATDTSTTTSSALTGGPATVLPPPPGASITGDTPCPAADGSSERTTSFEKAPPTCIDPAKTYVATFDTSAGTVKVQLDAAKMPSTTNNFVVLSRYHFYDDTAMFRTDPSIDIIQGGSPTTNSASDPGPGYKIPDEGGTFDFTGGPPQGPFTYEEGQLIMARSSGPDSSGAQFFFSAGPKVKNLDTQGTYLLFGTVTEGLDVLQAIIATHTPAPAGSPQAQLGGGPKEAVVITSVTIDES